jgi:RimJ/RimL family protein N-acetyltransferase
MGTLIIPTARLDLVLQTAGGVIARIEAMSPADRAQVSPDWLARVDAATPGDPWAFGFSVIERASGIVVGDCGYKGPPDAQGCVEIAYGLAADYRGRGYATEAARALVAFAFEQDAVRLVRAHTLPEENASTRVLNKCGFSYLGEVIDPEDGLVWRWEQGKERAEPEAAAEGGACRISQVHSSPRPAGR